jgi:hypothetical protein
MLGVRRGTMAVALYAAQCFAVLGLNPPSKRVIIPGEAG